MHIVTGGGVIPDRLFRQTSRLKRNGFKRRISVRTKQFNNGLNGKNGLVCRYKASETLRSINRRFVPDFSEKPNGLNFKDGISNNIQAPAAISHSKSPLSLIRGWIGSSNSPCMLVRRKTSASFGRRTPILWPVT